MLLLAASSKEMGMSGLGSFKDRTSVSDLRGGRVGCGRALAVPGQRDSKGSGGAGKKTNLR